MRSKLLGGVAILVAICGFSSTGYAQADPIAQRIALMKQVGNATKPLGEILKGNESFDLAKVREALETYQKAAKGMPSLFPDDSKVGTGSTASLKIWTNKADFEAKFVAWGKVSAAAATRITDEASFKIEMKTTLGACKGCHDDYRLKKPELDRAEAEVAAKKTKEKLDSIAVKECPKITYGKLFDAIFTSYTANASFLTNEVTTRLNGGSAPVIYQIVGKGLTLNGNQVEVRMNLLPEFKPGAYGEYIITSEKSGAVIDSAADGPYDEIKMQRFMKKLCGIHFNE